MDVDCAGARGDVASQITFSRDEFATVIATALVQTGGRLTIPIELWRRLKECGINKPEHELPAWAAYLSDHGAAKERGNLLYAAGNYAQAVACYSHGVNVCPSCDDRALATLYHNRAAAYEKLMDYEKVVQDCTNALSCSPKYPKALSRRARAELELEQPEDALRDALAAGTLENFACRDILELGERALKQISIERAKDYMLNQKPTMPSKYFVKKYLKSFANDPLLSDSLVGNLEECALSKAFSSLKLDKFDDIVELCTAELASETTEKNIELALLLRATFYGLLGLHSEAEADLSALLEMPNVSPEITSNALIKKACLNFQRQETDSAVSTLDEVERKYPENSDVYYHRGQMKLVMERISDAANDFEKCLLLSPNFIMAAMQRGYCDYRQLRDRNKGNDIRNVFEPLEKLTQAHPDVSEGYVLLGQALQEKRFYEEAENAFDQALQLDSGNVSILVYKGLLHESCKPLTGDALLHAALAIDEQCQSALQNLGSFAVKRGDTEQALEYFRRLLPSARCQKELEHVFSLIEAGEAQLLVKEVYGIDAPFLGGI